MLFSPSQLGMHGTWQLVSIKHPFICKWHIWCDDIVEAHCYFVDIGRTDHEQIRNRINKNDCRTFRPWRPLSTVLWVLLILLRICSRSVRPICDVAIYAVCGSSRFAVFFLFPPQWVSLTLQHAPMMYAACSLLMSGVFPPLHNSMGMLGTWQEVSIIPLFICKWRCIALCGCY